MYICICIQNFLKSLKRNLNYQKKKKKKKKK